MRKIVMNTTGVYVIKHIDSGKRYVGSTTDTFGNRWNTHRKFLRTGKHHSTYLQNAWSKYGEKAFAFRVVKRCPASEVLKWEQHFIDKWKCALAKHGYNMCPTAGNSIGRKSSPEQIEKHRVFMRTFRHTEETKRKLSEIHKGKVFSQAHKDALSLARRKSPSCYAHLLRINQTVEARERTRQRNKNPEHAAKVAAWHRGKKRTGQALQNIRDGMKRRYVPTPEEQLERTAKRIASKARNKAALAEKELQI